MSEDPEALPFQSLIFQQIRRTLDSLVEGTGGGGKLPRAWGRFLGQESACKSRLSTRYFCLVDPKSSTLKWKSHPSISTRK